MTESEIEKELKAIVHKRGGLCFKFISPSASGVPDRIVIAPGGKVVFVELKTDKGKVKELQSWQIARINKLGGDARVLRGIDEVREFINKLLPDGGVAG